MKASLLIFVFTVLIGVTLSIPRRPNKWRRPSKSISRGHPLQYASSVRRPTAVQAPKRTSIKPQSLDGWLSAPKQATTTTQRTPVPAKDKKGYCDHRWNFGIRCGVPMDQCSQDKGCPGNTKCCPVSDCGYMCVMPKEKPSTKHKKELSEPKVESVTTAAGLKVEDITSMKEELNQRTKKRDRS